MQDPVHVHGCKRGIFSVREHVSCRHCFHSIRIIFFDVDFSDEVSQFGFCRLGLTADGEVSECFYSIFVPCNRLSDSLRHLFEILLGFLVIEQRAEGQLLCDILSIVSNPVLARDHVQEVIKAELYTHSHVIESQTANFGLDVVRRKFRFNGGLNRFACVPSIACDVDRIKHVFNRLLHRLCVRMEQFERRHRMTGSASIRECIFDMDFATALPDGVADGNEREGKQDDHVQRFATGGYEQYNGSKSRSWNARDPRCGNFPKHSEVNGFGAPC